MQKRALSRSVQLEAVYLKANTVISFLLVLNIYPFDHCDLERGKQGSDSERIASNDQHIHRICIQFQTKKGK